MFSLFQLPLNTQLMVHDWPYRIVGHAVDSTSTEISQPHPDTVIHYYLLLPEPADPEAERVPDHPRAILEIWPLTMGYGPEGKLTLWRSQGQMSGEQDQIVIGDTTWSPEAKPHNTAYLHIQGDIEPLFQPYETWLDSDDQTDTRSLWLLGDSVRYEAWLPEEVSPAMFGFEKRA